MSALLKSLGASLLLGSLFYLSWRGGRRRELTVARRVPLEGRAGKRIWVTGIPTLGPYFWRAVSQIHSQKLERSGLVTLHALHGLLKGGLSLPSALFQLAQAERSSFSRSLRRYLNRFDRGDPLSECLAQFRGRAGLTDSARLWELLELGYRRGLPLVPLLERSLPGLEAAEDLRLKRQAMWKTVCAQAGLVAVLPWGLLVMLGVFQPEIVSGFLESASFLPIAGTSLGLEGIGLYSLWLACRYP